MKKPIVVLLAGGRGDNFKPFSINKTLFPFVGKSIVQYILENIEKNGFEKVIAICSQENLQAVTSFSLPKLKITPVLQENNSGMGDAVLLAEEKIKNNPILVVSASKIFDDNLFRDFFSKINDETYACILGRHTDIYFSGSYMVVEGDVVKSIIEKPGEGNEPSHIVNSVFDYFKKPEEFISLIKKTETEKDDKYELALNELMQSHIVNWFKYDGVWQKLKYGFNVLDLMKIVLENKIKENYISKKTEISRNATIEGKVYVEDGVKVLAGAHIVGPVYLGKNVIVGNNALVRGSMIEEATLIGFGSEIARSYVGAKCKIHNSYVGDSVLESNINVSYGTCLANLRMDNENVSIEQNGIKISSEKRKLGAMIAKNVFIGANSTTLPGVMIGNNSKIYPNTTVHHNVLENSILKSYQEQKLDQNT